MTSHKQRRSKTAKVDKPTREDVLDFFQSVLQGNDSDGGLPKKFWLDFFLNNCELLPGIIERKKVTKNDDVVNSQTEIILNPFLGNLRLIESDPLAVRGADLRASIMMFWSATNKFLRENPIPDRRFIKEGDLNFFESSDRSVDLTEAQKNALEVFRSVRVIQSIVYARQPIYREDGPIREEPDDFEGGKYFGELYRFPMINSMQEFNRLFGAIQSLVLAAIKTDFYTYLWPLISGAAGSSHGRMRGSAAGVKKKQEKNADRKKAQIEAVQKLWWESRRLTHPAARIRHVQKHWDEKILGRIISGNTIKKYSKLPSKTL